MTFTKNDVRGMLLFGLISLAYVNACAQVYRCTTAGGNTVFSQTPCPSGVDSSQVKVMPSASLQPNSNKNAREQSAVVQTNRVIQDESDLQALDKTKAQVCKPLSAQAVQERKKELEAAIDTSDGHQKKGRKILLLFLLNEEQYNQLSQGTELIRQDHVKRLTNYHHAVYEKAADDLDKLLSPGFDWHRKTEPSTGAAEWECRDLTDGLAGSWHKCVCKPRQIKPWRQGNSLLRRSQ
jgi:hypothetical protein